MAKNAVESVIHKVWMRLSTGRMKVFSSCQNWLSEFRIYRRDENGNIVKANDHLMDGTRYYTFTGIDIAIVKPVEQITDLMPGSTSSVGGWAR
jgi:hypothetical protein